MKVPVTRNSDAKSHDTRKNRPLKVKQEQPLNEE